MYVSAEEANKLYKQDWYIDELLVIDSCQDF